MPKSSFVDFKAVKAAVTMEQVLEHYGLLDKFKRGSDSLSGAVSDPQRQQPDTVPGKHQQKHLELFQRVQAWRQHPGLHRPDG